MKITETIERECCDFLKDMRDFNGHTVHSCQGFNEEQFEFCIHCGQVWSVREVDGEPLRHEPVVLVSQDYFDRLVEDVRINEDLDKVVSRTKPIKRGGE